MAENEQELTDIVNKEEKRQEKEGILKKAGKLIFNTGLAAATTAIGIATIGSLAPVVAGTFAGFGAITRKLKGDKLYDIINDSLKTYSSINAVLPSMIALGDATFPLTKKMGYSLGGKTGAFALTTGYAISAYNWIFTSLFKGARHLADNYLNPKGIMKSIKKNFWPDSNRFSMGFFPAYALAANGISSVLGMPTFALNAAPLAVYNELNPIGKGYKDAEKQKAPYTYNGPEQELLQNKGYDSAEDKYVQNKKEKEPIIQRTPAIEPA